MYSRSCVVLVFCLAACGSSDTVDNPSDLDPAPDRTTPGVYRCATCPNFVTTELEVQAGAVTSRSYTGQVSDAAGDGTFYVVGRNGEETAGPLPTDTAGNFSATIPLFCGEQLVKCVWDNAAGSYVLVQRVITTDCVDADIRVTLSWDDKGRDFELHLVKPGGRINDTINGTDCTWTTCAGSSSPDWGVLGDDSDDPRKDVDNLGTFGPENIFLAKPETGRYHVFVEHWGSGAADASGQVVINVKGKSAQVLTRSALAPQHVWQVATIDWPAGTVTPIGTDFDCVAAWSGGCTAELPAP